MDGRWHTHRLFVEPDADPEPLLTTEWLLTNGTGGYAMGTAAGCNTRRYHGLLVGALRPPVERLLAVSQVWEQLVLSPSAAGGADPQQTLEFATLAFQGGAGRVLAPRGVGMLRQFDRGLSVAWQYAWGAIGFERELLLHPKAQAITLRYRVTGLEDAELFATLRVHPMLALRDHHALRRRDGSDFDLAATGREYLTVADRHRPEARVTLASSHGSFTPQPHWWERAWYGGDADRGQECFEDLFVPAAMETMVAEGAEVAITAALGDEPAEPIVDVAERAARLRPIAARLDRGLGHGRHSTLAPTLAIATDDFVVDRTIAGEKLSTILAGYPWFTDWGRDTFIALDGLLLCTGRFDEAKKTLRAFADAIRDGLVPNVFDDHDDRAAHYNTVDGSLWFIHAAMRYLAATGDDEAWRSWLARACVTIVDAYVAGTEYGIVMDTDGLITAGDASTQLTWMDAKIGDHAFTPRFGKAVEINALWHNAVAGLAETLPDEPGFADARASCGKLAEKIRRSFAKVFWSAEHARLLDTVWRDEAGQLQHDASLRPNQILAASLPRSPLPPAKQKQVVAAVRDRLLTPVGLRTLPPDDPNYHGRYAGDQWRRDEAYHQGTVWAWLIGPYAEAVLRTGKSSKKAKQDARAAITPLLRQLTGTDAPVSLGQLHEIYEADPSGWIPPGHPTGGHRPVGTIAQAWSVAEVVRVLTLIETT